MKTRFAVSAFLLALVLAVPARAESWFSITIGNAPPPPRVLYRHSPHWAYVEDEDVYYVDDDDDIPYDMFRCDGYVYLYNDDYWYRSRSYRGPFVAIRPEYVPRQVWSMTYQPDYRWRQNPHVPPSVVRIINHNRAYYERDRVAYRTWNRDRERDREWNRERDRHRERDRGRQRHERGHDDDDD